jgi:hypothetical protein
VGVQIVEQLAEVGLDRSNGDVRIELGETGAELVECHEYRWETLPYLSADRVEAVVDLVARGEQHRAVPDPLVYHVRVGSWEQHAAEHRLP